MRKHTASIAFVLAASVAAIGCGDNADTPPNNSGIEQARSALARIENPTISDADRTAFANGQRTFALDAYRILAGRPGNVVYSPHSVQVALAMTSAGARGTTASQMETALHFGLPQERLHAAFNALDRDLAQRATRPLEGTGQRFRLRSANALWGQRGYTFLAPFLDTLAQHYGAGMNLVDFMGDADGSRPCRPTKSAVPAGSSSLPKACCLRSLRGVVLHCTHRRLRRAAQMLQLPPKGPLHTPPAGVVLHCTHRRLRRGPHRAPPTPAARLLNLENRPAHRPRGCQTSPSVPRHPPERLLNLIRNRLRRPGRFTNLSDGLRHPPGRFLNLSSAVGTRLRGC
jgi:hypothetical protein